MVWLHGGLMLVSLVVGTVHLCRAVLVRRGRTLELAHAAMAFGMAGMLSPLGDPVPAPVWTAVFLLCGAWSAARLVCARRLDALGGDAMHVTVGSAAMLFMLGRDHALGAAGGSHPAHAAGAPGAAGLASALALTLAAYFVLYVLRCLDRLPPARPEPGQALGQARGPEVAPEPGPPPAAIVTPTVATMLRAPRVAALAQVIMTVTMATMMISMI